MPRPVGIATANDVPANPAYRHPAVPSIDDDASAPMVADVFRGIEPGDLPVGQGRSQGTGTG